MIVKNFIIKNLLFTLLLILPVSAGINFVQQNNKTLNPSGSSVAVTYPKAQTAGNSNIVVVGWNDTSAAVKSVTDSRGNSYALAVGPTAGKALTQSIYYANKIAGGSNTVTVTFNRKAAYPDVRALEYSGLDPTAPLDVTAASAGNSQNGNSGPATTTALNELIFGAGMTFDMYSAAGSGFTQRLITNFGDIAEDTTVLAMGSYSATAPLRLSAPWVMQMAAFRGSGQSSQPPPTVTAITPNSEAGNGGTSVTITGTGFSAGATVQLGGAAASNVVAASSTAITATTPAHSAGTVDVVVTNPDGQSATLPGGYTYAIASGQGSQPSPVATAITPNSGSANGGTSVTITGTGFSAGATVKLGGASATNVVAVSSNSITATAPAHTGGTVDVVVTNPDGQSATLPGSYTYTTSSATGIGFVQAKSAVALSGSSLAIAYPAAQTAGNLNVIAVMWGDTTSVVSSVTDSAGNIYAVAAGPTRTSGLSSQIYYAANIVGGSNIVTVTFNQTAGWPNVNVLEYSGLDPVSPLDVVATATGKGTIANSGSATTTSANQLIVGAGNPSTSFKTSGSGFSTRIINLYGGISEDEIVTSAGSYNATATLGSGTWVMQMATFRGSGQSSSPPAPSAGHTYTTNFPLTENPISEGDNWINAGTTGLDWTNMQTTPGFAFATQTGTNPALFDDSIAILSGNWGNNQSAQGTVQIVAPIMVRPGPCYQESEIFLRASISPHSVTGYEINVGNWNTANSYIHVVRWNGPFGNFTTILSATGSQYGVKTGDVFSAQMIGNVITVFINGVQKGQVTDSTYAGGSPGMGMYLESPSTCGSGANNFGFSSYTATDY